MVPLQLTRFLISREGAKGRKAECYGSDPVGPRGRDCTGGTDTCSVKSGGFREGAHLPLTPEQVTGWNWCGRAHGLDWRQLIPEQRSLLSSPGALSFSHPGSSGALLLLPASAHVAHGPVDPTPWTDGRPLAYRRAGPSSTLDGPSTQALLWLCRIPTPLPRRDRGNGALETPGGNPRR